MEIKRLRCRITTCTKERSSSHETGARSFGGGWYCNEHTRTHLIRAEDTGRLHYKTHLTLITLSDPKTGIRRNALFYRPDSVTRCKVCNRRFYPTSPVFRRLNNSNFACTFCVEYEKQRKYSIKSSSENVLNHCKKRKPSSDGLLMGMEWEISCSDSNNAFAKIVLDAIGYDFAIHKYDGSVTGFELNTAPASLAMQKRRVHKACKAIAEHGWRYDVGVCNAGIHIHVDRNFFTTSEEIEKFISFFCIGKNSTFITAIAGRNSSTWAARFQKEMDHSISKRTWYAGSRLVGKCAIVNVKHTNTLEVRAFASSLDFTVIAARLEFVACLARACRTTEFPVEANYLVFLKYLQKHKTMYPNLFNFTKGLK